MDNITINTIEPGASLMPIKTRTDLVERVKKTCAECLSSVDLTGAYFCVAKWGGLKHALKAFKHNTNTMDHFTYVTIRGSYVINQTVLGTALSTEVNTRNIKILLMADQDRINNDHALFSVQIKGRYEHPSVADYVAVLSPLSAVEADEEAIVFIEWIQHDVIGKMIDDVLSEYLLSFLSYKVTDGFHRVMGQNHQLSFVCDRPVVEARSDIISALGAPGEAVIKVYGNEVIVRWSDAPAVQLPAIISNVATSDGVTINAGKREWMDGYFDAADKASKEGKYLTLGDWKNGLSESSPNHAKKKKRDWEDDDGETFTIGEALSSKDGNK